jgi:Fic family protein
MRTNPVDKLAKDLATPHPASPVDRGESISEMEPMLISESSRYRKRLDELVFELTRDATAFRTSLPPGMVAPLCDLVRSMNCYYSNLIEGHNTHPVDIERALAGDLSDDRRKRDLQIEAKAHIATQRWIDEGSLAGSAATVGSVVDIHKRFVSTLPEDLLWVADPRSGRRERVIAGAFRNSDVIVGRHVPVSPGAVPRFLSRWESAYSRLGKFETVLQVAAAHHRLLWIHPFSDGNGRVARLVSYAMLLRPLDTGGIWSIARGLARRQSDYKQHLAACDLKRRNDLDGRGNLSEETLVEMTAFFLETCIDQIAFMRGLVEPTALRTRITNWAKEEERVASLPSKATTALAHILTNGILERQDVPEVTGLPPRSARRVTAALQKRGIITSHTHKAPFTIAFPAVLAPALMPGLYPGFPNATPG